MDKEDKNKRGDVLPFNNKSKIIDDLGTNEYGTQPMADEETIYEWGPIRAYAEGMFIDEAASSLTEKNIAAARNFYANGKRKFLTEQIDKGLLPEEYQREIAGMMCERGIERFNGLDTEKLFVYLLKNDPTTPESEQYSRQTYLQWLRGTKMVEINTTADIGRRESLLLSLHRQEMVVQNMMTADWKDRVALSQINGRLFESKHFTWAKEALEKKESSSAGGFLYSMDTLRVEMPEEFLEAVIWMVDEGALKPEEAVDLTRNGTLKYIAHFDAKDPEDDLTFPTAEQ